MSRSGCRISSWAIGLFVSAVAGQAWCFAQTPEWVATYDGPGSGQDTGWSVAFDPHGDVFVVGTAGQELVVMKLTKHGRRLWTTTVPSQVEGTYYGIHAAVDPNGNLFVISSQSVNTPRGDFITMKISSHGNLDWYVTYDGPTHVRDTALGLAVDTEGCAYVVGSLGVGDGLYEYATVKYRPDGAVQWVARYHGSRDGSYYAAAIALDEERNVYVTGVAPATFPVYDAWETVKYDHSGNVKWVARYDGNGAGGGSLHGIHADEHGAVYVTGTWRSVSGGKPGFLVVKYNSTGEQQWERRYEAAGDGDELTASSVDSGGNTILVGSHREGFGNSSRFDFLTVKVGHDGTFRWAALYDGPGHLDDFPAAVAVDASGSVYVSGLAWVAREDYATIKYSPDGQQLWAKFYSGWDYGADSVSTMAIDQEVHIVVTGTSAGVNGQYDIATVKYDSDGNQLWVDRFGSSGGQDDFVRAVGVDGDGNVIVTGASPGYGVGGEFATIKYDADGGQRWVARHSGLPAYSSNILAIDERGAVAVTGRSPELQFRTIKYRPNGHEEWVADYRSRENAIEGGQAVAVDASGDVCVTGTSESFENGSRVIATIKYDAHGRRQWAAIFDDDSTPGAFSDAAAIAIDRVGNTYVVGSLGIAFGTRSILTIKYDPSGWRQWFRTYPGQPGYSTSAVALRLDSAGNPVVTGYLGAEIVTIKYDPDGTQRWATRAAGGASAMAIGKDDSVVIVGSLSNPATEIDIVTIKYSANGIRQWVATYDGPEHGRDRGAAVAVDAAGSVYATGTVNEDRGNRRVVVIKYDANGHELWMSDYGGSAGSAPFATDLALDSNGNVIAAGGTWSAETGYDYLVLKYSACDIPNGTARTSSRNGRDIQRLMDCLLSHSQACRCLDIDGNGVVDSADVEPLVAALIGN